MGRRLSGVEEQRLPGPGSASPAGRFCRAFGIDPGLPARELLSAAAAAFSQLPYENLTKIIRLAEAGRPERAHRLPEVVLREHLELGTGGTCFSLTATFLAVLRELGFDARPILADRHYGENTHSALIVRLDGANHLLGPGYLVNTPVGLSSATDTRLETAFNSLLLRPIAGGRRLELHVERDGRAVRRLTYKTPPVDEGEFLRAWEASFSWEMMRYPVLARAGRKEQIYLQARRLQVRRRVGVESTELALDRLAPQIAGAFGVSARIVARALDILDRQGELRGQA